MKKLHSGKQLHVSPWPMGNTGSFYSLRSGRDDNHGTKEKKKSFSLVYFQYKNALESANQTGSQVPVPCSVQTRRISISQVNKAAALRGSWLCLQDREVCAEVLQGSGLDFGTSGSEIPLDWLWKKALVLHGLFLVVFSAKYSQNRWQKVCKWLIGVVMNDQSMLTDYYKAQTVNTLLIIFCNTFSWHAYNHLLNYATHVYNAY